MNKNRFALVWVRWLAVLPGALCAGLLATFPLHWILYFAIAHDGTLFGIIELPDGTNLPIEKATYPFVIAITFVLVGYGIAPKHKFRTAVVLALLYALLAIGALIFALGSGLQLSFSGRSVGPVAGLLLGLFLVWQKSKLARTQAPAAAEKPPIAL